MQLSKIKQKRAAIELSIGTIVIIVIAMTMLILGVLLVRNIFTGATDSVDSLNDKVKAEITNLFTEETAKIALRIPADRIVKVKSGSDDFGMAFGAQTKNGANIENSPTGNWLRYWIEKTNNGPQCSGISILDHDFGNGDKAPTNGGPQYSQGYDFEDTESENGYVRLVYDIPDGTEECTQRYKIHVTGNGGEVASASFRVQISSGGIFS